MGQTDNKHLLLDIHVGCRRSLNAGPAEIPQHGPLVKTEVFLQDA